MKPGDGVLIGAESDLILSSAQKTIEERVAELEERIRQLEILLGLRKS